MFSKRNTTWLYRSYRRYGFRPSTLYILGAICCTGLLFLFYGESPSSSISSSNLDFESSTSFNKAVLSEPRDKNKQTSQLKRESEILVSKSVITENKIKKSPISSVKINVKETNANMQTVKPKQNAEKLIKKVETKIYKEDPSELLKQKLMSYGSSLLQNLLIPEESEPEIKIDLNDGRPAFHDHMAGDEAGSKEPFKPKDNDQIEQKNSNSLKENKNPAIPNLEEKSPLQNNRIASPFMESLGMLLPVVSKAVSGNSGNEPMTNMLMDMAGNALPKILGSANSGQKNNNPFMSLASKVGPMILSGLNANSGAKPAKSLGQGNSPLNEIQKTTDQKYDKNEKNENKYLHNEAEQIEKSDSSIKNIRRQPLSVDHSEAAAPKEQLEINPSVKAAGNFMLSNVFRALPDALSVPEPNSEGLMDIAFRSAIGDLRDPFQRNNLLIRTLRELSYGGKTQDLVPSPPKWVLKALQDPIRVNSESSIRSLLQMLSGNDTDSELSSACSKVLPFGGSFHWRINEMVGSQLLCEDLDFKRGFDGACKVYSFSSHPDLSFEESMTKRGCKVWIFGQSQAHLSTPNERIRFMKYSLGVNDDLQNDPKKQKSLTLETIMKKLNHTDSQINYYKLDLEGQEWEILEEIVEKTPFIMNRIQQLGITVHLHEAMRNPSLYRHYLDIQKKLLSLGFQIFGFSRVSTRHEDLYSEPLLKNQTLSLTNYVAYMRI